MIQQGDNMDPKHMMIAFHFTFIGIAIAIMVAAFIRHKRRIKDFRSLAAKMGFTFKEEKNHIITDYQMNFKIFDRGRSKKITAYMEATKNETTIAIFDYKFITGGGKNSTTHKNTFIIFQNASFAFPEFTLMQEHMGHKLLGALGESIEKQLLGFNDIDFADSPEFSKQYLLGGKEPEKIKELFTPAVRETLEKNINTKKSSMSVMAKRDTILFYMPQRKIKIKNIPAQIQVCSNILKAFTD